MTRNLTAPRWMRVHDRPDTPGADGLGALHPDIDTMLPARQVDRFDARQAVRWDLDRMPGEQSAHAGGIHLWRLDDGRWALGRGVGTLHWIGEAEAERILADNGNPGRDSATRVD